MTVEVGSQAPDFTLKNQDGQEVSLKDFRGERAVLLVFYPFAFSGICTGELCSVRDDLSSFQNDDVQVLGVSCDAPFSLKAWAAQEGYEFPLLSDFWPHGAVAESYGVFNSDVGMAIRGTFLIDKDGVVRFAEQNGPGDARDQQGWRDALKQLA
ncbi:peroxiredoxin (alkyl hydroperoxide reductase subunit C) [Actinomycetospora succinea]|uniref:Alkyl hydroperoxide reductase E n=1 Tax=Actinomycetospora succinea TaxID=663603 RepID=A0A4R6UUN5_9PSEU|nr:peroxiredoxin [Actinomycetospora succinea]TDQ50911.1 peroxiredoxin (alkyl hydroperoxide reductase subunit C) [Actinomycetospora succinea]